MQSQDHQQKPRDPEGFSLLLSWFSHRLKSCQECFVCIDSGASCEVSNELQTGTVNHELTLPLT